MMTARERALSARVTLHPATARRVAARLARATNTLRIARRDCAMLLYQHDVAHVAHQQRRLPAPHRTLLDVFADVASTVGYLEDVEVAITAGGWWGRAR